MISLNRTLMIQENIHHKNQIKNRISLITKKNGSDNI